MACTHYKEGVGWSLKVQQWLFLQFHVQRVKALFCINCISLMCASLLMWKCSISLSLFTPCYKTQAAVMEAEMCYLRIVWTSLSSIIISHYYPFCLPSSPPVFKFASHTHWRTAFSLPHSNPIENNSLISRPQYYGWKLSLWGMSQIYPLDHYMVKLWMTFSASGYKPDFSYCFTWKKMILSSVRT